MSYVDGFVVPVAKARLAEYKKLARLAKKVWMEHGALAYLESLADDAPVGKLTSFPRAVKLKEDEVVVFSYILLQLARAPRPGQQEGDGRPAHRRHGPEEHAVRRQAHDLGRVQAVRAGLVAAGRQRPPRSPVPPRRGTGARGLSSSASASSRSRAAEWRPSGTRRSSPSGGE